MIRYVATPCDNKQTIYIFPPTLRDNIIPFRWRSSSLNLLSTYPPTRPVRPHSLLYALSSFAWPSISRRTSQPLISFVGTAPEVFQCMNFAIEHKSLRDVSTLIALHPIHLPFATINAFIFLPIYHHHSTQGFVRGSDIVK